eukprot:1487234-Prymnesium_polylepis.1
MQGCGRFDVLTATAYRRSLPRVINHANVSRGPERCTTSFPFWHNARRPACPLHVNPSRWQILGFRTGFYPP